MGPSSLPVSGKVNRPQSADQSGSRFVPQGATLSHGSRPTSQQPMRIENSIPLPKRNVNPPPINQSGTKLQRNSLTSQHLIASRKSQQQAQVVQIIVELVQLLQIVVHIKYSSPLFSGVFTPN